MATSVKEMAVQIITNPEFQKLQYIGGGKEYHNEGSAFVHSLLVFKNSFEIWSPGFMNITALLHDIGKIYTGRPKENGDWEYPNHAKIGADNLYKFIPECYRGTAYEGNMNWFIANHIKPLFWTEYPEFCIENVELARLAICDLKGSYSAKPQTDKISFLQSFINEYFVRKRRELD